MAGRYQDIARFDKTQCHFSSCMICKTNGIGSLFVQLFEFHSRIPYRDPSELRGDREQLEGGEDEEVLPQPQSSQRASRGRFSPLLVSVDSLRALLPYGK